jgi:hypothetical protein
MTIMVRHWIPKSKWSVTRFLNPVKKNGDRITNELRQQAEELNWNGLTFPVTVKDIKMFEENNNIGVWVYSIEDHVETISINPVKFIL